MWIIADVAYLAGAESLGGIETSVRLVAGRGCRGCQRSSADAAARAAGGWHGHQCGAGGGPASVRSDFADGCSGSGSSRARRPGDTECGTAGTGPDQRSSGAGARHRCGCSGPGASDGQHRHECSANRRPAGGATDELGGFASRNSSGAAGASGSAAIAECGAAGAGSRSASGGSRTGGIEPGVAARPADAEPGTGDGAAGSAAIAGRREPGAGAGKSGASGGSAGAESGVTTIGSDSESGPANGHGRRESGSGGFKSVTT